MANTTDTFWEVDGVSLNTLAHNIVTWGGDREAPPKLRGKNSTVPSRPGTVYVPKTPDSRIITLSMWVIGADADGNVPAGGTAQRALFEKNWKDLRRLLWTPRRQLVLTKRFKEYGDTAVTVATAHGEYVGGLNPTMNGKTRAVFTVDLELTDPYFYGPVLTTPVLSATPTTVNVKGDDRSHRVKLNITGARTKAKVTNVSPQGTVWAELDHTVVAGSAAIVDSYDFRASVTTAGVVSEIGSRVNHDGSPFWLFVEPGANKISVTSLSGTGAVTMSYQAAYL